MHRRAIAQIKYQLHRAFTKGWLTTYQLCAIIVTQSASHDLSSTGGSAINLSQEQYAELATNIAQENKVHFIITAGPGELPAAEALSKLMNNLDHHIHYSTSGIVDFCKYINISDIFISGSTGPLHIAAALNVCTAAFYPARRSATSLRWQTINDKKMRLAFMPENHIDDKLLGLNQIKKQFVHAKQLINQILIETSVE